MMHAVAAVAAVALSVTLVAVFPRSIVVFLAFQGSMLFVYVARIPAWLRAGLLGLALLVLMPLIGYFNGYYLEVATQVGIFAALALGLNIVVGLAGLLDLGYVAFFAFGAYTTALLTGAFLNTTTGAVEPALGADMNFYVAVWIVALLAAGVGLLIGAPVLRLGGDYLAIVTLGLGEIVSIITASKWAQPLVGGPQGMRGVSKAEFLGLNPQDNSQHFYYLALAFVLARLLCG